MVSVKSSIAIFAAISTTMAYSMENDLADFNDNEIYARPYCRSVSRPIVVSRRSFGSVARPVALSRSGFARRRLARSIVSRRRFLRSYRAGWRRVLRDGVWGYEEPASVVAVPAVEAPAVVEPAIEAPAVAEPVVEAPAVVEPVVQAPVVVEPVCQPPVIIGCRKHIHRRRHLHRLRSRRAVRRLLNRRHPAVLSRRTVARILKRRC
ncbi:hypothetical protein AYI69_g10875 [Smittium culicis]|uniref:Uncharacterized protein n=1 Tax=Smittium culicis TaxID=133412 RepID=A0A1R1X2X7_9FUNG|nr:hypothetical protein AYI69_g10875 [Smittium culicis]